MDSETTGLIQTTYIAKSNKSLKAGDEVKVKVISLIKDDRKIYLNFVETKSEPKKKAEKVEAVAAVEEEVKDEKTS